MARTTVGETIQRIRRQLSSSQRAEVYALNEALDATETDVDVTPAPGAGLVAGSDISIDLEKMRVTAVAGSTLTVIRGWLDSEAATHTSGATVWANPRFSAIDIYDSMIEEIQSWGPNLYRVAGASHSIAVGASVLELGVAYADAYGIIDVTRNMPGSDPYTWPRPEVRFQRAQVGWPGAATSGMLLRFIDGTDAGTVNVLYAMPFYTDSFVEATDLVSAVGLQPSMLDLLTMGVKLRLGIDEEIARLARNVQDEPRRAEETPAGAGLPLAQLARQVYERRKTEEMSKLLARWPIRYS